MLVISTLVIVGNFPTVKLSPTFQFLEKKKIGYFITLIKNGVGHFPALLKIVSATFQPSVSANLQPSMSVNFSVLHLTGAFTANTLLWDYLRNIEICKKLLLLGKDDSKYISSPYILQGPTQPEHYFVYLATVGICERCLLDEDY